MPSVSPKPNPGGRRCRVCAEFLMFGVSTLALGQSRQGFTTTGSTHTQTTGCGIIQGVFRVLGTTPSKYPECFESAEQDSPRAIIACKLKLRAAPRIRTCHNGALTLALQWSCLGSYNECGLLCGPCAVHAGMNWEILKRSSETAGQEQHSKLDRRLARCVQAKTLRIWPHEDLQNIYKACHALPEN